MHVLSRRNYPMNVTLAICLVVERMVILGAALLEDLPRLGGGYMVRKGRRFPLL
jgi:hypothetical protein